MAALRLVAFERLARPHRAGEVGSTALGEGPAFADLEARPGARRVGVLLETGPRAGDVVDLNRALAAMLALEDVGAPEAEADSLLPAEPRALLRRLAHERRTAEEAVAFVVEGLEGWDGPDLERAGVLEPRAGVRLCAPVPRPGKILGVARNYAEHAAERGARRPPEEPVLFVKASSAVIGPRDPVILPAASRQVDYEGELAVVIGRAARHVAPEEVGSVVAGYTVANDVTARDFQHVRGQHFLGKSCDTFCPLGPVLLTADGVGDPQDLGLRTTLSGRTVQDVRTKEMIFPVAELVAFASRLMTLEPGDVLLTGTPAGVGAAQDPPRWLRDGDVVEVEIEGIGRLCNPVCAERIERGDRGQRRGRVERKTPRPRTNRR